jgi:hypothetical protein
VSEAVLLCEEVLMSTSEVSIVVILPLEHFEVLERSAVKDGQTIEQLAAQMLAEVVEFGTPAARYELQRLAILNPWTVRPLL